MSSNTSLSILMYDDLSQPITGPVFTIPAGHVGKETMVIFAHTGTHLKTYVDAVEVGTAAPITGYKPQTTAMRVGVRAPGNLPAANITIYGAAGGNGVPALADVVAYFAAVKAARKMAVMPGAALTQGLWNVTDTVSILDSIGTDHLPVVGTPTLVIKPNPVWSW